MLFELVRWPTVSRLAERPRILLKQERWDDFDYRVTFRAWLVTSNGEIRDLGITKILSIAPDGQVRLRTDLPPQFESLDQDHVSLGQEDRYYMALEEHGLLEWVSALGDMVLDPTRAIRVPRAVLEQTLLRSPIAPSLLQASQLTTPRISHEVTLKGFSAPHMIDLTFGPDLDRVGALVGENGTGKTQLLGELALTYSGLSESAKGGFSGGVMAISYGAFDHFTRTRARRRTEILGVPYRYVGLRTIANAIDMDWAMSEAMRALSHMSEPRRRLWRAAFKASGAATDLSIGKLDPWVDGHAYSEALLRAAAGHQVIVMVLAHLVAYTRPQTLVLIDEPEIHLHPSLVSSLMRVLHTVLEDPLSNSFALIATHSPIPVQEIPGRMIRVVTAEGDIPLVEEYPQESFGEDISDILLRVFRIPPTARNFRGLLRDVIRRQGVEGVASRFPQGLPLNARIAVEAVVKEIQDDQQVVKEIQDDQQ